jgi:hypothetical protein
MIAQKVLSKLNEMMTMMLSVNTIVVVAQTDHDDLIRLWLKKNKIVTSTFLFAKISETQRKGLLSRNSVDSDQNGKSSPTISLKKLLSWNQPSQDIEIFMIESSSMVRQFIFEKMNGFEKFEAYIHQVGTFTGFLEHDVNISTAMGRLYPKMSTDELATITRKISEGSMDICLKPQVEFTDNNMMSELYDVLEQDTKRIYFEKFATAQQCTEGIIFYEDVKLYKKLDDICAKAKKAQEIVTVFLCPEGMFQINTKSVLVEEIEWNIQNGKIDDTLFDDVLREMVANTLLDAFCRFKHDTSYELMQVSERLLTRKKSAVIYKCEE